MDQILQMILEIVREQQREAADLKDTMTRAEVVELTMSMMQQQGIDEYHEDLEADIYNRIQYLAPRLFEHENMPSEPEIHMEKFSYRMKPTDEAILNNENLTLDHMVGNELQSLASPVTIDTTTLDYEQAYTSENPTIHLESSNGSSNSNPPILNSESISEQISPNDSKLNETFQDVLGQDFLNQSPINEETLNQLVMAKYMELANSGAGNIEIDSESLASLVMQALQNTPTQQKTTIDDKTDENEEVENLLKEIWESETRTDDSNNDTITDMITDTITDTIPHQTPEISHPIEETKLEDVKIHTAETITNFKPVTRQKTTRSFDLSDKTSILSGFYNTKTYMGAFADYLESLQENQPILTGFASIDRILETGLHSGLYLINSDYADIPSFCLQLADQMAKSGLPVCYLLLHRSRYECMAKSLSRLTYELRGKDRAITLSSLYKREENTDFSSLKAELHYYEETIANNLYFVESSWKDIDTVLSDIEVLTQSFEQNIGQKPVFLLDTLSLCKEQEELILCLEDLCSTLELTLITSIHTKHSNIEDSVYSSIDIELAEISEQDSFTKREIILESGNSLLFDICFTDGTSKQKKRCQLFNVPKFYYFGSR
ncbi:MAG: hypothetical protein ACI4F9_05950 [Lachnospiraceae bacterium]